MVIRIKSVCFKNHKCWGSKTASDHLHNCPYSFLAKYGGGGVGVAFCTDMTKTQIELSTTYCVFITQGLKLETTF